MVEHVLNRPSLSDGDLYFPPYRSHVRGIPTTTYAGWGKDKKRFDAACGVAGWTLHDLRRTFATRIAELGVLPHVVERLLNHRLGAISNQTQSIVTELAEIYNLATFLPQMREAIQVWENKLTALLRLSQAA
jgi:integrase